MQINTSAHKKELMAVLAGVMMSVMVWQFFPGGGVAAEEKKVSQRDAVYIRTSSLPLQVSGVVEAANSTIVYAEAAGVVRELLAKEGVVVQPGQVLAVQATPVEDARRSLAAAERELGSLNQSLATKLRAGQATQAGYQARSAAEIATLRTVANDDRVREVSTTLATALEQSVLSITESINYINSNRDLFSAEGLRLYNEVVAELYGEVPSYFHSGIMTGAGDATDLKALLQQVDATNPAEVEILTQLVGEQLAALTILYATAEADIFDRQSSFVTESMQGEYLALRGDVLGAAQSLQSTRATFAQVVDSVLEDEVAQNTTVEVTALDEELAATQATYTALIAVQSDVVAAAGEAVVAAEQQLGRPTAPFTGVVSRVFVDVGAYVMPGAPLLALVGDGARELTVSVPAYVLPQVAVGQVFMIDGKTVGHVDRFSVVSNGGSGTVVIALTNESPVVGSSLSGSLMLDAQAGVYQVPRSYVHFDADGPYVTYVSGETARAVVVYDAGRELYVSLSRASEEALVPAVSIGL